MYEKAQSADFPHTNEDAVHPPEIAGRLTSGLLLALARDCPDGLHLKRYAPRDLCRLIATASFRDVEHAAFGLRASGLVDIECDMEGGWSLCLADAFYEHVDREAMGWRPSEDARELARLMLAEDTGVTSRLHARSGWRQRQFNPALAYLLDFLPQDSICNEPQPTYATSQIAIWPEVRVALRRFLRRS